MRLGFGVLRGHTAKHPCASMGRTNFVNSLEKGILEGEFRRQQRSLDGRASSPRATTTSRFLFHSPAPHQRRVQWMGAFCVLLRICLLNLVSCVICLVGTAASFFSCESPLDKHGHRGSHFAARQDGVTKHPVRAMLSGKQRHDNIS